MIVVGYIPDQFGTAALKQAIAEAKLRNTNLLVINTSKGDSLADPRFAHHGSVMPPSIASVLPVM